MKTMIRSLSLVIFAALTLACGQVSANNDQKKEKTVGHYVKWAFIMAGGAAVCTAIAGAAFPEIIVQFKRLDSLNRGVGSVGDLKSYNWNPSAFEAEVVKVLRPNFIAAGLGAAGASCFGLGVLYNGLAAAGKGISSLYNKLTSGKQA